MKLGLNQALQKPGKTTRLVLFSLYLVCMNWVKGTLGWIGSIREKPLGECFFFFPFGSLEWQHSILRWHDGFYIGRQQIKEVMICVCSVSLRYLNASANSLESLPSACTGEESLSMLQLLYLTNNLLTDQCIPVLVGHPHLRILHLANNQLQTFPAR